MKLQPLEQKIYDITAPVIEDLGFAPFTVKILDQNGSKIVQVMAENAETGRLGIDDCTKISKAIAAVMDVEDPISGKYFLEVSGPGIDRLLIRESDFDKYKGFDVKIETSLPTESGQKKFRGILGGITDGVIALTTDNGEEVEIPFSALSKAKLVMSDELIKATANM